MTDTQTHAVGPKVSCIIPAYNEAERIGAVITAIAGHPHILEVIVVDDASSDETALIAQGFTGVRVIRLAQNQGKTMALKRALDEATGELVLLLDADLRGLEAQHISRLIEPVLTRRADISISLRQNTPRLWRMIGLDYISGERVFRREFLTPQLERLRDLPKFGFEVFVNGLIIKQNYRISVIRWDGVESPFKNKKYGIWKGIIADIGMLRDIFKTVPPLAILRQIYLMRRLRVGPRKPTP